MERVQHDDGTTTVIPDAVIAASENVPVDLEHGDPGQAKAGVKILHHRRTGVEAYLKASPAERQKLHDAAVAKLAPAAPASAAPAPVPAIDEDDEA